MSAPRSLADALPEEVLRVRRILFECVQERCAELGVHEGDLVRVGEGDDARLVLRTPDGREVPCPQDLARFIEVRR